MNTLDLTALFAPLDAQKAVETLERLSRHIPAFSITGGLASSYYLLKNQYPVEIRPFNDLDIVVDRPEDVKNSIANDFLICHYHPTNQKGKFHIVLIDKETAVRIDIFSLKSKPNEQTPQVTIGQNIYSLLRPEDLICSLLGTCHMILDEKTIDPKYFITMLSLYGLCNRSLVEKVWKEYSGDDESFSKVYSSIVRKITQEPQWLKKVKFRVELDLKCEKCVEKSWFRFATKEEVFKLR